MRDLIVLVILLGSMPLCLLNPYVGVLMWYWVAYFNPHRFTWSYAYDFPAAAVIAVPTLLGTLVARKSFRCFQTRETNLMLLLWIWCTITFLHATTVPLFAGHMLDAKYELARFSKILLLTVVMLLLVTTRERLRGLLLVTAFSFGLLAVKTTLFGIATSGQSRVWGPPNTFITDNNAYGLALNMSLPIFFFLAREEKNRWVRWALRAFFACAILSVILTYSRGGFLGLAVVLSAIMFRTRRKLLGGLSLALCAFLLLALAPGSWMSRMDTFMQGNLDTSAQQRLIGWKTAWRFAMDYPLSGGGFDVLPDLNIFQRYQPEALPGLKSQGPHSIYFQFLADHGFLGLALFLLLLASCMFSLHGLRRAARRVAEIRWLGNYADLVSISLLGYMVSGAFLGFGYFDLAYQMVATVSVLKTLFRQHLSELSLRAETERTIMPDEQLVAT